MIQFQEFKTGFMELMPSMRIVGNICGALFLCAIFLAFIFTLCRMVEAPEK